MMDETPRLTPIEIVEDPIITGYAQEAVNFLKRLPWCEAVGRGHLAFGIPELFTVFVLQVVPKFKAIPNTVWVVVFHEPRACSVCDNGVEWQDALNDFIWEMRQWVGTHPGDPLTLGLEGCLNDLQEQYVYKRR